MKYITHELKGTVGYIRKQTVFEIFKTILLFSMALGIFFIGYFTLGTKKSLWSVLAVLALLPASKALVILIMYLRYKSLDAFTENRLKEAVKDLPVLFENIITTSEKSYFVPAFVFIKGSLIGYVDSDKEAVNKVSDHMNNVMKNGGYKNIVIKIYDNEEDFINRVKTIEEKFEAETGGQSETIFNTIKAVSL